MTPTLARYLSEKEPCPSCIHTIERRFCSLENWETASALFTYLSDQDRDPERAGLRGVPAHGIILGASTTLPQLRACRLLRRLAQSSRPAPLRIDRSSDHRGLR